MNPTCPKNGKLCMVCKEPCTAPEVNAAATDVAEPTEPFLDIFPTFQRIAEAMQVETNFQDEITISAKVDL